MIGEIYLEPVDRESAIVIYIVLLSPFVGILAYLLINRALAAHRRKRRAAQYAMPLAPKWRQLLLSDFALYRKMPAELQRKLEGHIQVFLSEKAFVGCNGFEITDEVRLLIAAQACLLIINNPGNYYPGFQSILVYPETYAAKVTRRDGYLHTESVDTRAGESWHRGPVVLAWNEVIQGARDSRDGHNVVMHEFAHKLDEENVSMDGLPILPEAEQYRPWAEILSEEYQKLREHRDDVIDSYGATSAAEFFAVVTEAFFEKAGQLKSKHPALYQQFARYYRLDPAQWQA